MNNRFSKKYYDIVAIMKVEANEEETSLLIDFTLTRKILANRQKIAQPTSFLEFDSVCANYVPYGYISCKATYNHETSEKSVDVFLSSNKDIKSTDAILSARFIDKILRKMHKNFTTDRNAFNYVSNFIKITGPDRIWFPDIDEEALFKFVTEINPIEGRVQQHDDIKSFAIEDINLLLIEANKIMEANQIEFFKRSMNKRKPKDYKFADYLSS